jgi:hypothetical protein
MEPWSPVRQPYGGPPGPHDVLLGPGADEPYVTSYPASVSVMSHSSSSPQPPGIHTPSSTRSPSFAQLHLPPSPRVSLGSVAYGQDQDTPRVQQNTFHPMQQISQSYSLAGVGSSSQQVSVMKRKRPDQAQREPTLSPFSVSGEYVMVEPVSKPIVNVKRVNTKSSKAPRQAPATFCHEHYPPVDEKRVRKTSEFVARKTSNGRKSGGRSLGMHLPPEKAAKAKELRGDGACWICCLQRDSVSSCHNLFSTLLIYQCTAGSICERCVKRSQRSQMENGLGCDRTKLTELKPIFIPDIINKTHEPQTLKAFVAEHIGRWSGSAIKMKFNCIFGLPPLELEVYEFEPRTMELLTKIEYFMSRSNVREFVTTNSPPLGMVHIEDADRQKYDKYLNRLVDNHLDKFADRAFKFEKDDFQGRLLKLMVRLQPEQKDEVCRLISLPQMSR